MRGSMSSRFPDAIPLTADTVFTRPVEQCRGCGYEPGPDDYPLIDDDQCEDCHFTELQADEAEGRGHGD